MKITFFNHLGHNDLKYLGSTGFLPAFQTYICRWNNTCYNYSNPDEQFTTSTTFWEQFSNLTDSLSFVLNDNQIMANLTGLISQLTSIDNYISFWNGKIFIKHNKNISFFLLKRNDDG